MRRLYLIFFASGFAGLDETALIAAKWGLATALLLPQSILLGTTFPLFAAPARNRPVTRSPRCTSPTASAAPSARWPPPSS